MAETSDSSGLSEGGGSDRGSPMAVGSDDPAQMLPHSSESLHGVVKARGSGGGGFQGREARIVEVGRWEGVGVMCERVYCQVRVTAEILSSLEFGLVWHG